MSRLLSRFLSPMLLVLLAGCVPLGKSDAPGPVPAEEISVTALPPAGGAASAGAAAPVAETAAPEAETAAAEADTAAPGAEETAAPATQVTEEVAPPPPPPSPEALACQRRGGEYRGIGSGNLNACVKPTGEGGKTCTKETDCTGVCLARSGTCSPVTPLFGCNEILQADGRRVTLCIE